MSIPRDLKVPIQVPGGIDTTKINAAYSYGGPALAVKTVRNLLHIPINHVVNVNFGGFQRAVNRLGCVYVDVDRRYYHSNAGLPVSAAVRRDQRPRGLPEAVRLEVAGLRALPPRRRRPRALGAPAGLPAPGQGPDRARAAVRRPQGAAADLRALHRHRPALELGHPAPAQARLRVLGPSDPRGALPRRHRAGLRDHLAQQPRAHQAGVPARQGLERARASSAAGRPSRRARRPSAARAAPRPGCRPASSTTRPGGENIVAQAATQPELPALLPAGAAGARQLLDRRQPARSTTSTTATIAATAPIGSSSPPASTASTTACRA